ncbi:MAG TPA: hypothetical protein VFJ57_13035, partial [Solirubrobacterales bacterium]|nr:hypothetical protein [Solirubrobacterales bacterium]
WTLAVLTIWPPACASQPNEGEILMSRARSVLGIAVLFALALSAFAASSASASGATAFTCVSGGSAFEGAHCLSGPGAKSFKHETIPVETQTTGTATNANTAESTTAASSQTLKGTISGVKTAVTCPQVHGEGLFENKTTVKETGEMFGHAEGKLHYTGCEVKEPAGKGCVVGNEATITTEQLTGKTVGNGSTVKIEPKGETPFASIKIESCSIPALNNTFPVNGSVVVKTSGATLTANEEEVTKQTTLKFGGQNAGLEGALTLKAHSKAGEETQPLTVTATP